MKTISTFIILLCTAFVVSGQGFKDKYFASIGFSPFLDFGASPLQVEGPVLDQTNGGAPVYLVYQTQYSFAPTFSYEGRYNLTEPSEDMAISLKATPTISGIANHGILGLYFPIGVGLEMGNGSTYQTSKNMGFSFTAGYSLNFTPLFKAGQPQEEADLYNVTVNTSWGCPYIAAGIRYWNKKNKLREISIRYGFGSSGDSEPSTGNRSANSDDPTGSYQLRVTWMKYINY